MSEEKQNLSKQHSDSSWLLILKGLLMGAVEVIPGVSAGTIALITGVLPRLIDALKNINLIALRKLKVEGFVSAWKYIDGNFLVLLFVGMCTGFALLVQVVTSALMAYPVFIWSFFFGLILTSAVWLAMQIKYWYRVTNIASFISGFALAFFITVASPLYIPLTSLNVFFVAMLAISAMMLPGLSGSFTLMLVGMYQPILSALKNLEFAVIIPFMAGAGVGILVFSHVLSFLFHRFPMQVYACLTGVMLGSLNRIWPWQEVIQTRVNSHGEQVAMLTRSVSPSYYEQLTGNTASVSFAVFFMLLGVLMIVFMSRLEGLLNANTLTSSEETVEN